MIKCLYLSLETNFSNLVPVLTKILGAILCYTEGLFYFVIVLYIVKYAKNNFINAETNLQKLC